MFDLILIDGNYLGYGAFQRARPRSVKDLDVRSLNGFFNTIHTLRYQYPRAHLITLWDGRSWRYQHCANYKGNRSKPNGTPSQRKAHKERLLYKSQISILKNGLRALGIKQMIASNMEADDLAGMLTAKNTTLHRMLFVTGDKDWLQLLVCPSYAWSDPYHDKYITTQNFMTYLQLEGPTQLVAYKALMGDSDNIPGVGGFGEVRARQFLTEWGSVAKFFQECDPENIKQFHWLRKFYEGGRERYDHNVALIDLLDTNLRPPVESLQIDKGVPSKEAFIEYCRSYKLNEILVNMDNWYRVFEN